MKRKLFTLALLGVFLFSSTGFPIALHICSMNGLSSASACKMHEIVKEDHSCCSQEEETPVKITADQFDGCCHFKVIDRNMTDQLLSSGNDVSIKTHIKIILTDINIVYQSPVLSSFNSYTSSSPPLSSDNHIYLTNSILLI